MGGVVEVCMGWRKRMILASVVPICRALFRPTGFSSDASSLDDAQDDGDEGDHQEDMDNATGAEAYIADCPKDQQYDCYKI